MNAEKTAVTHIHEGDHFLESGNLDEAIAAYRHAIELNPDISWSYHHLGEALTQQGKLEEAIAAYRRAIELNPDFSWSYHHLGDALAQQLQPEEAAAAFRKAIELNPQHFGSYCGLGESLAKLGQLDEAIASYRQASNLNPEADWVHNKLGEVLQQRTKLDLEGAIASYFRAIELNPDHTESYYKLLELKPESFEVYWQLGKTLVKLEMWEKAIDCYRLACELNPNSYESYQQLGQTLYRWTQINLELLRSHPDTGKILLQKRQKDACEMALPQINDEAFLQAADSLTESNFVQEVYRAYLKREPQANEKETYSKNLQDGAISRQIILSSFRSSQEFGYVLTKYPYIENEIACRWRELEISHEYLAEEIACYQRAISLNPESYILYYYLGEALTRQGKSTDAIAAYQKAVQVGMFFAKNNRLEEALSCYRKTIEIIPEKTNLYSELVISLLKQGLLDEVLACSSEALNTSINSAVTYHHNLSILMAQQGLIDEAIVCLQKTPQIPVDSDGNVCDQIWNELNQLNPLNETNIDCHVEIKPKAAEEYFRLTSRYKIITHTLENSNDRKYLEKMGLSLANVQLIAQDNFLLQEIYIKSFADHPKHLHQPMRLTLPYQQVLVETGYVYAVCPFSGKIIRSNQSFVINHQEVGHHDLQGFLYRFVGREIFYLMTGCPNGEKLLIYIPRLELIIHLNPVLVGFARSVESINKFKSYMVSCWQQVLQYISTEAKQVVDVIGLGFNIGHYLWQDLAGIHVLIENEIQHKLDKILTGPGDYFNCREVFPEIPANKFIEVENVWDLFKTILDNNYVAFRANGIFIKEQLVKRVCHVSLKNCSQDFLTEVKQAKKHFPLLGVQIRTSSRVWLGQAEGIANIIKSLSSDFPNLGVVFDGWSLTGKENSLSTSWSIIEKEKAIMEEILALIPPTINTYSAIGATTFETVVWWTQAIEVGITSLGAGMTFSSWIANHPNIVVHASTFMMNTFGNHLSHATFRENLKAQVLVPNENITDGINNNYDCDWRFIYNQIVKFLNQMEIR
ncbi:tetratricopeptide repeat protein [Microcoleus sp. S28C3]|uniref:tetratricopeptide repeat protein n=1 Tax=Microcoleus sp. S28C3 TaxID=3055414 RepID=UPI002FCECAF2